MLLHYLLIGELFIASTLGSCRGTR